MKYLKIDNNKGYFWNGKEHQEIDKINKKDLLNLLNLAETDKFEMDPYDEKLLANKAHQIIYENIYAKFDQFLSDKTQFDKEAENLYKDAINKYSVEIDSGDVEEESEGGDEKNEGPADIRF